MGKSCCTLKCGMIACFVVGAILVILGGISVTVYDVLFVEILKQESLIAPGTTAYEAWEVVTTPTFMSYYFYNITNPKEFLSNFASRPGNRPNPPIKAHLEELGPYTFREYLSKDNIEFLSNLDPEQVFYRQKSMYVFDPENSASNLDDLVTTVNIIGISLPWIADHFNLGSTVDAALNALYTATETDLLATHSVQELLFGLDDPILDLVSGLTNQTITFGLFSTSNNSAGWFDYQVYTGRKHTELTNIITTFKNMTKLDYWYGDTCNAINGTDGTSTPPFMEKEDPVYFFVDDICRSIYAVFEEETTLKRVPAWKYIVPSEVFEAPTRNANNFCFCPYSDDPLCQHDGGLPLSPCQFGTPVLVSSPHFLYSDGFYPNLTEGISPPVKEEHETALLIEPNTGVTIKADKRLQINFLLRYKDTIRILQDITDDIIIPVVWLNESATLGQSDADLLYGLLVVPEEVVDILQIVLCTVGGVMVLASLFYALMVKCWPQKSKNGKRKSSNISNNVFGNGTIYSNGTTPRPDNVTSFSSTTELVH